MQHKVSIMIIDAHVHLGLSFAWASYERWNFGTPDGVFGPERFIPQMDELGITKAVIQTTKQTTDNYQENLWITKIAADNPDRFIPISLIHPYDHQALPQLEKLVTEHNSRGLKLHPFAGCYAIYLPTVYPIIEKATKLKIPVMIHSGTPPHSLPTQIGLLADHFPQTTFIMAHAGLSETYAADARYVALRYDNIFLEVSCLPASYTRMAIQKIGPERVIYGSDSPWNITKTELQKITTLELPSKDEEMILYRNIAQLLKIDI